MKQPACICGNRAQVYKNKENQYYVQCNTCGRISVCRNELSQVLFSWYDKLDSEYSLMTIIEIDDKCIEVVKDS